MADVLISGGTGFIGAHLARSCLSQGDRVTILARPGSDPWRLRDMAGKVELRRLDSDDADGIRELLDHLRPRHIFLLAATTRFPDTGLRLADIDQAVQANLEPLRVILDAITESGARPRAVVRAGSLAELSPDPVAGPVAREWPATTYGLSVLAGTHLMRMWRSRTGIPAVTARLCLTYGGDQSADFLIPQAVRQGLAGHVVGASQPDARRDLMHVDDIVDALHLIARHAAALPPVANVSTGRPLRTGDITARIARLTGCPPPAEGPKGAGAGSRVSAQPSAELRALGWRPNMSLAQGLRQVIAWERARSQNATETPAERRRA